MNSAGYYEIAMNDLFYLQKQIEMGFDFYNQMAVSAHQCAEKLLKSIAEVVCSENIESVLKTHNLKLLVNAINNEEKIIQVDMRDITFLKDFYFDARYPGENYINVSKNDFDLCVDILYDILQNVIDFRSVNGYAVIPYTIVKNKKEI